MKNCWNQTFIEMSKCQLMVNNKVIKISFIKDYQIQRLDKDGPDGEPIYYFGKIAFTIRNVPVLPYQTQSENIEVKIESWEYGDLAYGIYNYTSVAERTLGVGVIFDRDYYPDHNPGNAIRGEKINIARVWFQSNSKFGVGSKIFFKIP